MGEEIREVKTGIAAFMALITYLTNCISVLIFILFFMMAIDYITGVIDAAIHGKISSRTGIIGIIKKVGYFILVLIGFFADYILFYFLDFLNITKTPNAAIGLGVLVTVWLIATEAVSILENLHGMGVPFPPFMKKFFEKMQSSTEKFGGKYVDDLIKK